MKRKSLFVFFLFFLPLLGKAQFVDLGQDPAGLRWKQINTRDFQLIYPDYFEENAQKIANIFTALYQHTNSLAHKPIKISLIIHANGGVANGSVAWAPRKADLYTMPSQDPSDTWLEHLCVHEFRHVVQIDKVNQGLTKILYYLFGEQITIAITGLYLPMWFMEGDAVTFETAIGHLGRGRSPEFINEMKAQVLDKGIYSYFKAAIGSDKDFVPNRYTMGYFMVANARVNYGNAIWTDALNRIGRKPLSFAPFATSLKRTLRAKRDSVWNDSTFRSLFINADSVKKANTYADAKRTLYHDNFSELKQIWSREVKDIHNNFDTLPTYNKSYTNYFYPTPLPDGKVIAYKKGLQETGAFVLLDGKKEKVLTRSGVLDDPKFIYHDNQLVWVEYKPNFRWEHGGKQRLTSYDLRKGKYRYHRGRHNRFSPFAVGKNWGVVEVNEKNQAALVILDTGMKTELQRIEADQDELFIHPSYAKGKITTVVQNTNGIHLESIDPQTGKREMILPRMWYEMDNPVQYDSTLLFRDSFNGNNAFYLKKQGEDSVRNILNARYGVRFPHLQPTENMLYFSFYTADGYKPGRIKTDRFTNLPLEKTYFRLADSLKKRENWQLQFQYDSVFDSRRYRKFTHLLNFHSWGPVYIDQYEGKIDGGIVVYSQNNLSTLSLAAGYIINADYPKGAWMINAAYKGIWPIFSIDLKSGQDKSVSRLTAHNLKTGRLDTVGTRNRFRRTKGELTMQLPFNISRKNYSRYITPYVRYKIEAISNITSKARFFYTQRNDTLYYAPVSPDLYRISSSPNYYQMMEYGLLLGNQTYMTVQEIDPRWGQILQGGYAHTPWKKMDLGHEWWISGQFYFPGFATNHSISIYSGYQNRPKAGYYDKKILRPRGIDMYGYELTTLRTNYKLPLLFPDQHITSVLYVKRIDGGIFFDMGHDKTQRGTRNYYSYGIELNAGLHLFRLPFPITLGGRFGYETQHHSLFANLLFNIGFTI